MVTNNNDLFFTAVGVEQKKDNTIYVPRRNGNQKKGESNFFGMEDGWKGYEGPLDLVLVEGWMLGFSTVAKKDKKEVSDEKDQENMFKVDESLGEY